MSICLRFTHKVSQCDCCYKTNVSDWNFHFCDLQCLAKWLKTSDLFNKGFQCQDCKGTGFLFEIPSNGPCERCNGQRFVKNIQMDIKEA
jgi:hypothetical protein